MIVKCYKAQSTGFSGQDAVSWGEAWAGVDLGKSFRQADRDYLAPFFRQYFPRPPKRILEGGCGVGKYVAAYRRLGYDIRGVDFSRDTIDRIRAFDNRLPVEVGDITALPYEDGYFDCYYSGGVIEHFEEGPARPLAEARRVLKRGGLLLATVPYVNLVRRIGFSVWSEQRHRNLRLRTRAACELDSDAPEGFSFDEYLFDAASIRPFFERAGFVIEQSVPTDFLWGELGLALVTMARALRGHSWKANTSPYDQITDSVMGGTGNGAGRSLAYDFFVTENWNRLGFKLPLRLMNRLSGHMLFLVARAA